MIQIYNTLTRKKEIFKPLEEHQVKMYVCGPTVYNYIHIGNARSTVAFDTIRRYFEYRGYQVDYVSNFTDVDDKIIRTAKENHETPQALAARFIEAFKEDTAALNVKPACKHPQVVDHIESIIEFISELIEKEYAYVSEGDVYYRTRKFSGYGKLSHQSIDELELGASNRTGDEAEKKADPLDFALWKSAKAGEISWSAPWGEGRPGWHIECSVMATQHLGETIDIHGGGQDLEFPHHENEIAQSEAKTGKTFANYWMHNGYVTVGKNNEKMSKSLGNFVTVHELIQRVNPQVLRFFMATTHYRRPIQFNDATVKEAEVNLQKIKNVFENLTFRKPDGKATLADDSVQFAHLTILVEKFMKEMDDDFNTANGITVIYELVKWLNVYSERVEVSQAVIVEMLKQLSELLAVFGIEFGTEKDNDEAIDDLIKERDQARVDRNFARSDEIRDLLKELGVTLEDTAQGTRWRRN